MEPTLELKGLKGSYLYYDCQAPFVERLCLENVIAATELGASAVNYAEVTGVLREGSSLSGVHVRDTLSGEAYDIRGHLVVNATGHWVDSVLKAMGTVQAPAMRRSKGIHIITPQISRHAVAMFSIAKGRHFFIIPWLDYSLIGITDTEYSGDLDIVEATMEDVVYVLEGVREAFPSLELENVLYTMAGLRALADSGGRSTRDLSRKYEVVDHEKTDGMGSLISVLGGKITAYRAVAEDTVNLVCHKLGSKTLSSTAHIPLPGVPSPPQEAVERAAYESGLATDTITHLANLYGSRYRQVLDLVKNDAQGGQKLCPHSPDIVAQVWHSIEEGSRTISDFLLRRSTVGMRSCQGLDAADTVAREMGSLLGWSAEEQQRQVEHYRTSASLGQAFRGRDQHKG
jgi:glycerol-3-phosphate dehydrogenase